MSGDPSEQSDRRKQILEAALRVFGTKGFHKATNKDIADEAGGISPGLIYHYFKDKQDLFLSILRERTLILQLIDHPDRLMGLPPREGLKMIGNAYLSALRHPENAALLRIMISELTRFPGLSEMIYRLAVSRVLNLVSRYLQYQVELGRLRPHDSMTATRSFIGMFIAHVLVRELFRQPEAIAISEDDVIGTAVDIFLHGLEAQTEANQE